MSKTSIKAGDKFKRTSTYGNFSTLYEIWAVGELDGKQTVAWRNVETGYTGTSPAEIFDHSTYEKVEAFFEEGKEYKYRTVTATKRYRVERVVERDGVKAAFASFESDYGDGVDFTYFVQSEFPFYEEV